MTSKKKRFFVLVVVVVLVAIVLVIDGDELEIMQHFIVFFVQRSFVVSTKTFPLPLSPFSNISSAKSVNDLKER